MINVLHYAWLVPAFPLIGFLINGLLRNSLSKTITGIVGSGAILLSFLVSCWIFVQVKNGNSYTANYFDFIAVGKLSIPFAFQIDPLSSLFLLIITGVGFLIHLYSTAYMHHETAPHFARYFAYLNLFVFSMLLLVLGANYVIMFIGWEGVGLCSYLLIGYWFKNTEYNNAAKKAFVMNRIGDLGFLLAVFWMILQFGTTNFSEIFSKLPGGASAAVLTGITLCLFVGAMGKSAQIPLYTWLPDAMAGPTPVSALIHAATMVTAGVYMIARSNALYSLAPFTMNVVAIIGLATAILAATIALKQNDIKKILAYSTVSQLGFMFLALGVGAYSTGVFHVMTHAFFKALMFLGAGSVIHAMGGEQDIRKMGGLKSHMKITYLTFFVGCLAIAGFPPFSGFFSKDAILAATYEHNKIMYGIALFGAMLTAFYMFRLFFYTFFGKFRGTHEQEHHLHESPAAMTIPLIVLAILATVGGFVGIPEVFAEHGNSLAAFLSPVIPIGEGHGLSHNEEYMLMGIAIVAVAAAVWFAFIKTKNIKATPEEGLGKVLENKWYIDELYDAVVVKPTLWVGSFFNTVIEKSGIDKAVNGVGKMVQYSSRQLRLLQSGNVGNYILIMVLAIIAIIRLVFYLKY